MKRTVLVDNSPYACAADPANSIPIHPYYDAVEDTHLDELLVTLRHLSVLEDVRPFVSKTFRMEAILKTIGVL
jgi:TFIIF-interacting CTD phosphatase-like protein